MTAVPLATRHLREDGPPLARQGQVPAGPAPGRRRYCRMAPFRLPEASMSATLVLTEALPEPGMGVLAARADLVVRVLPAPTAAALRKALPTADGVVMVMEAPSLSADLIECASRLRVACRMGAGYDNFDVPALTRRRIPLATAGSANAATVAEHALYLMLALAKRVLPS
ncbi:MAG: hypothetical protein EHM59_00130, partial [Betaproteobacteria bacterium]